MQAMHNFKNNALCNFAAYEKKAILKKKTRDMQTMFSDSKHQYLVSHYILEKYLRKVKRNKDN